MSDLGDDFMNDDEEAFEYEDEDDEEAVDEGEEMDVDLENRYYNAKGRKEDDVAGAVGEFQAVVDAEGETKGEWGFKSLKQMTKISFKLGRLPQTLQYYTKMLNYVVNSWVAKSYSEKSINRILDYISSTSNVEFLEQVYQQTLGSLEKAKNERLSIKTNLKLAKLLLDRKDYPALSKLLRQLRDLCMTDDQQQQQSQDDMQRKGTQLMEIYALEIQMYTETDNNKKLKEIYQQCLAIRSAIPHPRVMGIIRECGGKMHMNEKDFAKAQQDFFESFKNYDEAGSPQRIQCLKYLALASMLSESEVDPFDSQETKPYKNDPQILAITNLISAYQRKEITEFQKILKDNKSTILDDPFIMSHLEGVLHTIRAQVLLLIITPYKSIRLDSLAAQLGGGVPVDKVEDLIVELILDGRISGKLDQIHGKLELTGQKSSLDVGNARDDALIKWTKTMDQLLTKVMNKFA